jgi:hypothetical protein
MAERKQTAAAAYEVRRRDVDKLADMLKEEVAHHAEFAQKDGINWAHAGDLSHVQGLMIEALCFLAQQEPGDVTRRLREELSKEGRS